MKLLLPLVFIFPSLCIAQIKSPVTIEMDKAAYKIIHVGVKPDFLAVQDDAAWVVDDHQNRILKLSPNHDQPLLAVNIAEACTAPVIGFGAVWIMSCAERKLYRVDNITGKIIAAIPTGMADSNGEMSLAVSNGSVWLLSDSTGVLTRIDPKRNAIEKKITVLPHSYCAASGFGAVWITNRSHNSVQRIDPVTNQVTHTIPIGANPRFLTVSTQSIWTLNQGDGTVSRIDPSTNKLIATINVKAKGSGGDITANGSNIWVVSTNPERPVQIINARNNIVDTIYSQKAEPGKTLKVDGATRVSEKYVWVSGYYAGKVWVMKRN